MSETLEKIAALESRSAEIRKELFNIAAEIFDLKASLCPVKVGDVVVYRGEEFKVIAIDNPEWSWVYANPRRKDGSWGTAKRHLLGNLTAVSPAERVTPSPPASDQPFTK